MRALQIVAAPALGAVAVYRAALLDGAEAVLRPTPSLPGEQRCGSAELVMLLLAAELALE